MNSNTAKLCPAPDPVLEQILEEITGRIQAGDPIDFDACVAAHPEHAEQLRGMLPAMQLLAAFGGSQSESAETTGQSAVTGGAAGVLGDFRIVREIGRGGMGVVYEAEQISIGRQIALKVLPFASMLDPRRLARFRNEIRAAGQLHHSNIVPVYAVGADRGVHFYAMQLVAGKTVAEVISEMKHGRLPASRRANSSNPKDDAPPGGDTVRAALSTLRISGGAAFFRSVAKLAIQAAEALEHAHSCGVVHRDIKPSNLMIDERGTLWLTDFGLASMESGSDLTVSGDLLGTLRYMSPEQTLGARVVLDHRTDIYSLGATLYELLTLTPAFDAENRGELLRQINYHEPRPPRRLAPAIPHDLETIVLKAMSKQAADRYATSEDLADDLRRFLTDQPIRARRPSILARAHKWGRRHASLLGTAAASAMIGLVIAAGSVGWAIRDRQARYALSQRELGLALEEAARFTKQANWPSALAAVRRAESLDVSNSGDLGLKRNIESTRRDIDMALRLEQIRLDQATTARVDGEFDFENASPKYAAAFHEYGIDVEQLAQNEVIRRVGASSISAQLCAALDNWACAPIVRGSTDPFPKVLVAIAKEVEGDDWRNRLRDTMLISPDGRRNRLTELAAEAQGRPLSVETAVLFAQYLNAAGAYDEAEVQLRSAYARNPANFWVTFGLGATCYCKTPHQLDEAIRFYSAAIAIRASTSVAHNNLGLCLLEAGRNEEAIASLREAIRIQPDLAKAHNNLAFALSETMRLDEAVSQYREAIRLWPESGVPCHNLGQLLHKQGEQKEAIVCLDEAIRREPKFAGAHQALGDVLLETGKLDAAISSYREAVRIQPNSGSLQNALGVALARGGLVEEAIPSFREAIRLDPNIAQLHYNLAEAFRVKGTLDKAIESYRDVIQLNPDHWQAFNRLGNIFFTKADWADAIKCYRNMVRLRPNDAAAQYKLGDSLLKNELIEEAIGHLVEAVHLKPDSTAAHNGLGNAYFKKGELEEAIVQYQEAWRLDPNLAVTSSSLGVALHKSGDIDGAIQWHKKALQLNPNYTYAHYSLGCALRDRGEFAEALESFENAVRTNPQFRPALADCAWLLTTCVDNSLRNSQRALELANRAVALDPESRGAWRALGAAQYRNEDLKAADVAEQNAIKFAAGGKANAFDWALLAMIRAKQGRHDEARHLLKKAHDWIAENNSTDKVLLSLAAEADGLVGSEVTTKLPQHY